MVFYNMARLVSLALNEGERMKKYIAVLVAPQR